MTATVFIVDDDDSARIGLQRLMKSNEFETETFASAAAFLERLPIEGEACVILDQHMPGMTGLELVEFLAGDAAFSTPIIFLTAHADVRTSVKAVKLGAEDFLPKMADDCELLDAIQRSLQRSREDNDVAARASYVRKCADRLTNRESEVCGYVVAGWTNGQIAKKLGITERTVKAHRSKVMEKFEVATLADLVRQTQVAGIELPD